MAPPQRGYSSTKISGSNWNLEMLVFEERGKPEYPGENLSSREENQQQTQPTYGVESENLSRATLVGVECSHHCAIPAWCMEISMYPKSVIRIIYKYETIAIIITMSMAR